MYNNKNMTKKDVQNALLNLAKIGATAIHNEAKKKKYLSKAVGNNAVGNVIKQAGYGRRTKRATRRKTRRKKGGNFLSGLGNFGRNLLSIPLKGLAGTAMGLNAGVQGLGKVVRRRRPKRGGFRTQRIRDVRYPSMGHSSINI